MTLPDPLHCIHPGTGKEITINARDYVERLVLRNAVKNPTYGPYCLRCSTMERMQKIEFLFWRCRHCQAVQDSRPTIEEQKDES